MATVELRGVRKTYPGGGTEVIRGIDLAVADGEVLVILGPSGCGKSTLLRMVAGLESVTEGTIAIGGRVVNRLEPKDRDIAMVFQTYALYPHMTVYDNMAYGLRIRGLPRAEIDRRVRGTAAVLELTDYLARKPRQLSGGQRQRVAMGRAIVREPAVFLFDEPLSNLDAKLRTQMRVEIKTLQRRLHTTSLYVTHDQIEAMTLADRILVMNAGAAEQVGAPLEIYCRPASLFVAGFIGSPPMNLLPGRVTGDGRAVALEGGGVIAAAAAAGQAGRAVVAGLRPEHLRLAEEGEGEGEGAAGPLPAVRVELVEALGADTVVHGRLDGPGGGATLLARLPGGLRIEPGDRLGLTAAPEQIHLFDRDTTRRLP